MPTLMRSPFSEELRETTFDRSFARSSRDDSRKFDGFEPDADGVSASSMSTAQGMVSSSASSSSSSFVDETGAGASVGGSVSGDVGAHRSDIDFDPMPFRLPLYFGDFEL